MYNRLKECLVRISPCPQCQALSSPEIDKTPRLQQLIPLSGLPTVTIFPSFPIFLDQAWSIR